MRHLIPFVKAPPLVAVIRMQGVIAASGRVGAGLNDATLGPVIERAFRKGKPAAIALVINSPGGSAAQSSLISARIRRLAAEKNVPVHAFVEDVAASGGYWLACAADSIWADPGSIVGSIGVISASFGFQDILSRHGVERRVQTAGTAKSFNDPFLPQKPEDRTRLQNLLDPLHAVFIDHVKSRRGDRLDASADLFNGDIWVGQGAVDVGLIDGIAHLVPKMKELFGDKVRFAVYGPRRGLLGRFGLGAAEAIGAALDDRALWARYGL